VNKPLLVHAVTMGCDKNLVDSEMLLGHFQRQGLQMTLDADEADIWILNTCGFIDAARRDSFEAIETMLEAKEHRKLIVTGCLSQEHRELIEQKYPEIDLLNGVGNFEQLVASFIETRETEAVVDPEMAAYSGFTDRPLLTPSHLAFVKLGEGCNYKCAFCRIPKIRGRMRSRSVAEIHAEVAGLIERGVEEINLISQNTSDYGAETGESLLQLVESLGSIEGLRWLRLHYLYPGRINLETFRRILAVPKVVPYVDMPMQHASPAILKAMQRPSDIAKAKDFFLQLRADNPDLVLRTTMLLGFPGEMEEDLELAADFLAEVQFDHMGTYHYSPEEGTAGAKLEMTVDTEEVADREARLMDLQMEISLLRQQRRLDREYEMVVDVLDDTDTWGDVLAELDVELDGPVAVARTSGLGYEIDGVVLLPAGDLQPGQWFKGRITAVTPFDAFAEPVTS
jgi:ribosomal protein S12 methylthiotransferase